MKDLFLVSSHQTGLTLLSVAGEASLHGALGAGQGDTDPLGLGPALTLHLLAADDLMAMTIDIVVSWSESHTLGDKSDEDSQES